ncbi:MAG TPA: hypothetical protein PLD25_10030 [Chloroflexota bacterium]|nr:hypothetical protein [Chloroflexota bacterium]
MRKQGVFFGGDPSGKESQTHLLANLNVSRKLIAGIILLVALIAFELFNFDTTRYALDNLLGEVSFAGLRWATILAVAFCAIDFAGLARLFTPERGRQEPTAVWYLMGAWLIAATMNAMMTWWAVSVTLLSHDFGNEVLSREQLLRWVPFFVATLVWLTRILFIGAFSVAGEYIFDVRDLRRSQAASAGKDAAAQPTSISPTRPVPRPTNREQPTGNTPPAPVRSRPGPPRPATRPAMSARPSSPDGRASSSETHAGAPSAPSSAPTRRHPR